MVLKCTTSIRYKDGQEVYAPDDLTSNGTLGENNFISQSLLITMSDGDYNVTATRLGTSADSVNCDRQYTLLLIAQLAPSNVGICMAHTKRVGKLKVMQLLYRGLKW